MVRPALVSVVPEDGRYLMLEYGSGERKRFDVAPYMTDPWYGKLAERTYSDAVRVPPAGTGIERPHGQDIAPHELCELSVVA